jgi:hypothetical protein
MRDPNFDVYAAKTIKYLHDATIVAKLSHWNCRGPNFYEGHLLFDRVYEDLNELMDPLIEQVRAFGFSPDFNLFSGPGVSLPASSTAELIDFTLTYVMDANSAVQMFFVYCNNNLDHPLNVALSDHLGGMASAIAVDQYLLQSWQGY